MRDAGVGKGRQILRDLVGQRLDRRRFRRANAPTLNLPEQLREAEPERLPYVDVFR